MGRTAKYRFPLPGRKQSNKHEVANPNVQAPPTNAAYMSKAQRVLGTNGDLNIDSPSRSDAGSLMGWRPPSSGVMSVAVSESTQASEATYASSSRESGVLPRRIVNNGMFSSHKARSNTNDASTHTSSLNDRLRSQMSDSTLKSYYDRQKSPLAVSQQTSDSSARDLALRKGHPPVAPVPPTLSLQLDHSDLPDDSCYPAPSLDPSLSFPLEKQRKKPTMLDLARLFPKHMRSNSEKNSLQSSPSTMSLASHVSRASTKASTDSTARSLRRRTQEPLGRDFAARAPARRVEEVPPLPSHPHKYHKLSPLSVKSDEEPTTPCFELAGSMPDLPRRLSPHEEYLQPEQPQPHSDVQHGAPDRPHLFPPSEAFFRSAQVPSHRDVQDSSQRQKIPTPPLSRPESQAHDGSSWKHVRSEVTPPRVVAWDTASVASGGSQNTRTSRRSKNSAFSSSNLQQHSVLSLSSDDESGTSDIDSDPTPAPAPAPVSTSQPRSPRKPCPPTIPEDHEAPHRPERDPNSALRKSRSRRPKQEERHGSATSTELLRIPTPASISSRISGPWSSNASDNISIASRHSSKRISTSTTASDAPSATSVEFMAAGSGRFMAVTKQEEALLEALRHKRARMKEAILREHQGRQESAKQDSVIQQKRKEDSIKDEIAKQFPTPPPLNKEPSKPLPRVPARAGSKAARVTHLDKPPMPNVKQSSQVTSIGSKFSTAGNGQERIVLRLDTPVEATPKVEAPEPSPDLSDFLTTGSDEDSTPRSSWLPPPSGVTIIGERLREDSLTDLNSRLGPLTPPGNGPRLSAVGSMGGLKADKGGYYSGRKRYIPPGGVRFLDEEAEHDLIRTNTSSDSARDLIEDHAHWVV